jgi:hypothetical protein
MRHELLQPEYAGAEPGWPTASTCPPSSVGSETMEPGMGIGPDLARGLLVSFGVGFLTATTFFLLVLMLNLE